MGQTIVCAIDTKTADEVVGVAGDMAARLDARLLLVHVQDDPPLLPGSVAGRERARNRLHKAGSDVLNRAGEVLPESVRAEHHSELGAVVPTLCRVAEEAEATLLVAGCRRRGALVTSLLGSVSHDLSRHAPCPILIVPEVGIERPSRLAATDGSPAGALAA